jgi:hypothetical protein
LFGIDVSTATVTRLGLDDPGVMPVTVPVFAPTSVTAVPVVGVTLVTAVPVVGVTLVTADPEVGVKVVPLVKNGTGP